MKKFFQVLTIVLAIFAITQVVTSSPIDSAYAKGDRGDPGV